MTQWYSLIFYLAALLFVVDNGCLAAEPVKVVPSDPFAYCSQVGSIDVPAGGSSPIPLVLKSYVMKAFGVSPKLGFAPERYSWRCMHRAVYVCNTGANIPCDAKADLAKSNLGAENYCRENLGAGSVPAYATGHGSIYSWRCSAGRAVRGKQLFKVDVRGFQAEFWYRVAPR
jgi:hypothetical protein